MGSCETKKLCKQRTSSFKREENQQNDEKSMPDTYLTEN